MISGHSNSAGVGVTVSVTEGVVAGVGLSAVAGAGAGGGGVADGAAATTGEPDQAGNHDQHQADEIYVPGFH